MRRWPTLALAAALALPAAAQSKPKSKKGAAVELPIEQVHPSGAFSFRTPAGWSFRPLAEPRDTLEASGDGLRVRFYFREQDLGLDATHVLCIDMRLRGAMETSPRIMYTHDFLGSEMGERRALDSAFDLSYDIPVDGATDWHQRNVTIVGKGQSLCAIGHAPKALWRKTATKKLLDGILASVTFR